MTVYKYFLKVAMRQKSIILGYLGIFLILTIINSASTNTAEGQFTETKLNIGIVDNSNTDLSRGLINYLSGNNTIINMKDDREYIKEEISLQAVDGVIIIPEDFKEKLIKKEDAIELYENNIEIGSLYLNQQINKYLVFLNGTFDKGSFNLEAVERALKERANIEISRDKKHYENRGASTWFTAYFNFTSYIIMAIYTSVIGLIMIEFKNDNLEKRTEISSKKLLDFNKEIYLGQVSLGYCITIVFVLASILLKGKHIAEVDFTKYILNIGVFSFSILCFTFLINNLTKNRFIINGISTVTSLGISFLSGVMVPQKYLGEKVLLLAKFFPTYYFVKINEVAINSFMDIAYEITMQIIFGIVFLLLGLYFAKLKQKA